jgi:ApaG protein
MATKSNSKLGKLLYSSLLRSGESWEREVLRGRLVLGEKNEIRRLKGTLPSTVGSHLREDIALTGAVVPSLTRQLWRDLNRPNHDDDAPRRHPSADDDFSDAFASLRVLNNRTAALQQLVYEPHSQCNTNGILIEVRSYPLPFRMDNNTTKYSRFEYRVEMTNLHPTKTFKLLSRHWLILDGDGQTEEVRGPGVVGLYPVLAPGQNFHYKSSSGWMATPYGTMHGSYQFVDEDTGDLVEATIAPFGLNAGAEQTNQTSTSPHKEREVF